MSDLFFDRIYRIDNNNIILFIPSKNSSCLTLKCVFLTIHEGSNKYFRVKFIMKRYKLVIAYDGSNYAGWQIQRGHRSIQGMIEQAFNKFTGEQVRVHASGRTDQGVHARAQVAHVDLNYNQCPPEIIKALNALLPLDIRVMKAVHVDSSFHARRSAISKEYRYFIWDDPVLPPFQRLYYTHVKKRLNVSAMRTAARLLKGEHDFSSFTANPNREVASTVRNLMALTVSRKGHEVIIKARSNGFLYKMVRSLTGFLIRVGDGSAPPCTAENILRSRKRTSRVPTAPPQGLFLWHVYYPR